MLAKFQAALTGAGIAVSSGAYQADIDVDQVFIDPALFLTKAQIKAPPISMKKFGNGFTTFDAAGIHAVAFVVPDAAFAAVQAIIAALKALA